MVLAYFPEGRPALFDLHSHTRASDGLLSPEALVARAVERSVTTLAITDHDTLGGIAAARRAIADQALPLALIAGVEISTLWEHHEIHVVGLNVDVDCPALGAFLTLQAQRRDERAAEIGRRLARARIEGALEGAQRLAQGAQLTRGHFARYLVERGYATCSADVFKHFLARGKTGYVPPQWGSIAEAVTAIHQAGGVAVLAHPGRYRLSGKWLKRLLTTFCAAGGDALEVAQCQQPPHERHQLGLLARQFALSASQGSDFHQPTPYLDLGRGLSLPDGVLPVWTHWASLPQASQPGASLLEAL
ncbi:PHP domain-containing protein [Edwardsiella piscicida]|uniref:5'-3' exoribonuclease Rnm n=3 Tax=Edwardsiella TaxID=635 RepID=A0A0H3DSJ9_EDWTF|nr:PHP domain-containing protein [Edwardsiella piscicida]ACY84377.1 hypothetical protein ETAE_1536 [Edwardsiella tarda EIB202]ADM41537.1 hypothetical protein ETAF_1425 [Edwardsiella tarda FL6-60]AGH73562.1 hypothetical protein ETAC_07205 [Edwardsiella piscicida C07-087]AOP44759.2 PHP domain-containing protein [Edwardsiella piscicida]ARD16927.1 phosphatase [Edwardsiella piscicida]